MCQPAGLLFAVDAKVTIFLLYPIVKQSKGMAFCFLRTSTILFVVITLCTANIQSATTRFTLTFTVNFTIYF